MGEKYGSQVLPSTLSSLEFNSWKHQLIHRVESRDNNDQRLNVPRSLRSSSKGSRRSRTGSAASSKRLNPPRKKHVASVSRVGTPSDKSPQLPAILVHDEKMPRNEGGDNHLISSSKEGCAYASGYSELDNLYQVENQNGQDVFRLKTLR